MTGANLNPVWSPKDDEVVYVHLDRGRRSLSAVRVNAEGQAGGWTRGLDVYPDQAGPDVSDVALHPGVLNRQGWWLLDDGRQEWIVAADAVSSVRGLLNRAVAAEVRPVTSRLGRPRSRAIRATTVARVPPTLSPPTARRDGSPPMAPACSATQTVAA